MFLGPQEACGFRRVLTLSVQGIGPILSSFAAAHKHTKAGQQHAALIELEQPFPFL